MKQNVVVLPGTRWQIPLIKKLKNRGYNVIVFDYYENQPAYKYADDYKIVDILDKEEVLKLAKEFDPIAVMSDECDIATNTIAWVSEKLRKPTIGMEMARLYTDKYKMRVFLKQNGFATPQFYKCYTIEDTKKNFEKFGRKMIMKPLDGNSSRGVYSIEKTQDITDNFEKTIKYSKKEKCVLLEEYIEGEEFSVDGLMTSQGYFSLAISHKKHYIDNENLDQELIFRYDDKLYNYDKLREINKDFVEKTGIKFALTHAEYKYKNGIYYLIEIGARGGGNLISSIINYNLTGIDSQEILIDWATGKNIENLELKYVDGYENRVALLSFFDVKDKNGVVNRIDGIDYLESNTYIQSYHFNYCVGDTFEKVEDGGNRFGYYIAVCESLGKLEEIKEEVSQKVFVDII